MPSQQAARDAAIAGLSEDEIHDKLAALEEDMLAAAEELHFERAAEIRDEIKVLEARL